MERLPAMNRKQITVDGNEAAAYVAFKTNEAAAIFPITPSSAMGESADSWAAAGQKNIWGMVPIVREMQSEGGAAGAVHGMLQTGALTTTFTASQGLLLMLPNMFKIAGELTSTVFHVAARSLAAHSLSIFGDHSDVMAARPTGWAMLFAGTVQEVMDFALIAQASTLESRVPFLHVFDGFRTSHEVSKVEQLTEDDMRALINQELVRAHRERALSPEHPVIRGTSQNPDVFFQSRERANLYYQVTPGVVQGVMDRFAARCGRRYQLFEYVGSPYAERVIVMMGSGASTVEETVAALPSSERIGLIKVRLYRPFSAERMVAALPPTVRAVAVLDRTKEPGSAGEPLYQDVLTAITEGMATGHAQLRHAPRVIGGRYGLASKEFTPAMAKAVFEELANPEPKNHFSIGIKDDVTFSSLPYDPEFEIEPAEQVRAVFWGLGSDGTVGANKNSIKIIGEQTSNYAQGYFVYDSKKSGAVTISHLRFGPRPIQSPYLIRKASFVAVHQFSLLERYPVLDLAQEGATFLLNSPYAVDDLWDRLPRRVQEQIIEKKLRFFAIAASDVAKETGMGGRINTIMQTCFFSISGILPREEAIEQIKTSIKKTYSKRGDVVVQKNYAAVDASLAHLHEVTVPPDPTAPFAEEILPADAPDFVRNVIGPMMVGKGDDLPVSALPADGTYPLGTSRWEKRSIALEAPVWETDLCIQCGKCVIVCPHAAIRAKAYPEGELAVAPSAFKTAPAKWRELPDHRYTIQVAVDDCTGCRLCVDVCPVKDRGDESRKALNMSPQSPLRELERANWNYFLNLPDLPRVAALNSGIVKNLQLRQPLFEFSGACAGCGETPYVKLVTQLFGDRALIANATGCSSIYGGNLPTTPYTVNREGRGPAWSNSLFEDNGEFGLGMRVGADQQTAYARRLLIEMRESLGSDLVQAILTADQSTDLGIEAQRDRVAAIKMALGSRPEPEARDLLALCDALIRKSVWIFGGDGWAYDIGFGGLDHVLASGQNVNVLVLDTEVYSNTGGQASKATPLGATAKFAAGGKATPKKDLAGIAMTYESVYVAQIALGASDQQALKAVLEAEAYDGPSLVLAYSHCIAHGIDISDGMRQQRLAVQSGHWPLFRYDPRLAASGKNPFQLDSREPTLPMKDYFLTEGRYTALQRGHPEAAAELLGQAEIAIRERWRHLKEMAQPR